MINNGRTAKDSKEQELDKDKHAVKAMLGAGGASAPVSAQASVEDGMPALVRRVSKEEELKMIEKRRRAAQALTNILPESVRVRQVACKAGILPAIMDMMTMDWSDPHLHRLSLACLSNLSVDLHIKETIGRAGSIPYVAKFLVLDPTLKSHSIDTITSVAHASACLWSLAVGEIRNKQRFSEAIMDKVLRVLDYDTKDLRYARKMACGCIAELCIGNESSVKENLQKAGAMKKLIPLLRNPDVEIHRLAASALCNLISNNAGGKKEAKKCGLVEHLCGLLMATTNKDAQYAAAGGIYNLATHKDLETIERYGVMPKLLSVPVSANIGAKLQVDAENPLGMA